MIDPDADARRYRIRGRVQGVGFRWWCKRTADELDVAGSVRNLPDGDVEVIAVADRESLARFESRLRAGPSSARVDDVRTLPAAGYSGERALGEPFAILL